MPIVYESEGGGGGSGTVQSVTAADTSIVIAGTATDPTVKTGTLDVIAADHPPAADWSNNSHKITGLANGVAASDAAAFGQIPTALVTLLFSSTLGAAAASIDTGANGIAGGFNALLIYAYVRTADASQAALRFRFNNDSGGSYYLAEILNNNGTLQDATANAATSGIFCNVPSAGQAASQFGSVRASVPLYAATTSGYKQVNSDGGFYDGTTRELATITNTWRSTAAITRMSIFSGAGGNLVAGSALLIYGMP